MKLLFRCNIAFLNALLFVGCGFQSSDNEQKKTENIGKYDTDSTKLRRNKQLIEGRWYYPNLDESYIEVKGGMWQMQLNQMNIFASFKINWINS